MTFGCGSEAGSDLSFGAVPSDIEDGSGAGDRKRRRYENRSRRTEEVVAQHVWKRFTPASVNEEKCRARMWSGGRGGQCTKLPLPGRNLCGMHAKSAPHGLVTDAIPHDKLQVLEGGRSRSETCC